MTNQIYQNNILIGRTKYTAIFKGYRVIGDDPYFVFFNVKSEGGSEIKSIFYMPLTKAKDWIGEFIIDQAIEFEAVLLEDTDSVDGEGSNFVDVEFYVKKLF